MVMIIRLNNTIYDCAREEGKREQSKECCDKLQDAFSRLVPQIV
jgi:hypothetical protein